MPDTRRADVAATTIARVADAFDAFCAAERLPLPMTWPLRVALDEIVSNIVIHGGAARPPRIDVGFRRLDHGVEVTVTDDGPPFDPMARPEPDVTLPIEARQPGGLGIALVKSLVDRVRYERIGRAGGGNNVLVLWKTIPPEAGVAGE